MKNFTESVDKEKRALLSSCVNHFLNWENGVGLYTCRGFMYTFYGTNLMVRCPFVNLVYTGGISSVVDG